MPTELRDRHPVARKSHRCSMCTGPIEPGSRYRRTTYLYDGAIYDWLDCSACTADGITLLVWEWSGGYYYDEGVGPEQAGEWATETVIHGSPDDQRAAKDYLERAEHP